MSTHERRSIRCAIYTRKSSEEGLEQSFNSLDAQREACQSKYVENVTRTTRISKRQVSRKTPWFPSRGTGRTF